MAINAIEQEQESAPIEPVASKTPMKAVCLKGTYANPREGFGPNPSGTFSFRNGMWRSIQNGIGNLVKHMPAGGHIVIDVRDVNAIEDGGRTASLLRRFAEEAAARGGGLTIVAETSQTKVRKALNGYGLHVTAKMPSTRGCSTWGNELGLERERIRDLMRGQPRLSYTAKLGQGDPFASSKKDDDPPSRRHYLGDDIEPYPRLAGNMRERTW